MAVYEAITQIGPSKTVSASSSIPTGLAPIENDRPISGIQSQRAAICGWVERQSNLVSAIAIGAIGISVPIVAMIGACLRLSADTSTAARIGMRTSERSMEAVSRER